VTDSATITTGNDMIATASSSTITGVNPGDTDVTAEFQGETATETLSVAIDTTSPPELQGFVWNRQDTSDEFAIQWSATDDDGNLDAVTVELLNGDSVIAAQDAEVDGGFASGTTTVTGAGADAVRGVVTDETGNEDDRTLDVGTPAASDDEEPPESVAGNESGAAEAGNSAMIQPPL